MTFTVLNSLSPLRALSRTAFALGALAAIGCTSGPARVHPPAIDPDDAGQAAIEMYDTNGDGVVAGEELNSAPGLQAARARLDTDNDGGVSAAEVARRIEQWQAMRTGLTSFSFTVSLDGSPLEGATVVFEPEPFLGGEIKPARTTTDRFGGGGATIAKEDRPDPATPPGMHLGLYQVKISKVVGGKETIPPRYHAETILGQEVAPDVPEIANNNAVYALTTK